MIMEKLKSRNELPILAHHNGCADSAEIGVFDGKFSEVICRNIPNVYHICVDTWSPSRNHRDINKLEKALSDAKERLKEYHTSFYRMKSVDASNEILDKSLDFIYIDAAHDYKSVLMDLISWYPKLRSGGLFSGHDFSDEAHQTRCVKKAVEDFALSKWINDIYVTKYCPEDNQPSWYWIKK